MKIAIVSLSPIWEDKSANKESCKSFVKQAARSGAELVIFPEMTLTGFSMNTKLIREVPDDSSTLAFFSKEARDNNIAVAFGVVFEKDEKATNNLVVIDKNGNLLSNYAKIHPFSFSGEDCYYVGGNEFITTKISDAGIGLTICYDLRFPEIFQVLSKNSNIILTIANWPEKRVLHWNTLLQARAIENQLFIIGVNRTGTDGNNLSYVKSSAIFDPLGEKMVPEFLSAELDIYDLKLEITSSVRYSFPVRQDRRTELYKSLL